MLLGAQGHVNASRPGADCSYFAVLSFRRHLVAFVVLNQVGFDSQSIPKPIKYAVSALAKLSLRWLAL